MKEKILEKKSCKQCNSSFDITDKDLEFYDKVSPSFWWIKYSIPTPTLCPDCRQQRRLSFRNEKKLYRRKSDLDWEDIISIFSPENRCIVYSQKQWWWDDWDCLDYWMNYDNDNTFFEQLWKLILTVPHISMSLQNWENSDFSNFSQDIKNCYLCTRTARSEDMYYCYLGFNKSDNCFDCFNVDNCHKCYELIDSKDCFRVIKSSHCNNSSDLLFCDNCQDCSFCYGSSNLVNKKFYFFNKEFSEDEYFKRIKQEELQNNYIFKNNTKQSQKHFLDYPVKAVSNMNCENCTWNNLTNSKDIINAFDCSGINSGKFLNGAIYGENQYDTDFNYYWYNTFELISCWESNTILYSFSVHGSSNVFYSYNVKNSSNIFGCVNIKDKQYCILNKQYTKEEYENLVPKIIEHMKTPLLNKEGQGVVEWWEFFPASISPFWYNETVAQEYFPLHKQEAIKQWYNWSDYESPFPKVKKTIPADKLPEDLSEIPDDILNWAVLCEVTKKPFKIIKQELDYYRKHNLPIPKRHPDQRHLDRIKLRNPRKLYDRDCDKCSKSMKTTYSPDREEKVYCEDCYNKEIY